MTAIANATETIERPKMLELSDLIENDQCDQCDADLSNDAFFINHENAALCQYCALDDFSTIDDAIAHHDSMRY